MANTLNHLTTTEVKEVLIRKGFPLELCNKFEGEKVKET
jgi:hypothetical protein